MSGGTACHCAEREEPLRQVGNRPARMWRILQYRCNHSAFNGYRDTPSEWSSLFCLRCHAVWRTKAAYADALPLATPEDRQRPSAHTTEMDGEDVSRVHAEYMRENGRDPYTRFEEVS